MMSLRKHFDIVTDRKHTSRNAKTLRSAAGATVERLESRTLLAATVQLVTTMGDHTMHYYDQLAEMNSGVMFTEWYSGMMGITKGTPATTTLVHTFANGNEARRLVSTGGRVFFTRWVDASTNELWSTDGTAAGTLKVPVAGLASDIGAHFAWGNKLFFAGTNNSGVICAWISDGTTAGTFPLIDTTLATMEATVITPTVLGGKLYFVAAHDNVTDLYETDGTRAGTHIIATPAITHKITEISNAGGKILLSDGFSLWTCTTGGVTENLGPYFGIGEMTAMNGVIYFGATLGPPGWQLYRTDGTATGTYLVAAVSSGAGPFYLPQVAGDKLYFVGRTAAEGGEWWVTDGTLAGSHLITDLVPGIGGPNTAAFMGEGIAACAGSVFFPHGEMATGPELWTTDGTAAGTRLIQDLVPGFAGSWPQTITATSNGVYFSSTDADGLFKYDPMLPPVATIEGTPTASIGGGPMTIQIRWTDDEGVDTSTLGNNDISVTMPGGTSVFATFVSYTGTPNNLVATYQIPAPPSSGWDFTYAGTYQVQTTDAQVSDIGRRAVAAGLVGTFTETFAPPVVSNPLVINGTAGNDTITVQSAAGVLNVYLNGALARYRSSDVTAIQVNGLDGGDVVNASGLATPVTIDGGPGNDSIIGGSSADLLIGGAGNDTINGGPGNDTIDGGMGADSLIGGGGSDVFVGTPTDISLSSNSVAENQSAGTVVGTLTSADPDSWETFTYTMVSGTGSADNASFQIAGNQLKAGSSLNYETRSSYSIRIRSTDADGLFTEKVFAINVADVNEAPTSMTLAPASVAENMPAGATVGSLSVVDPDIGETYSYEILPGVDQGSFAISGNQLTTTARFDYEAKRSYSITVRVHDGANTFDQSLAVSVTNVNEAPTGIALSNASVAENLPSGTTVGGLSAIDPDTAESYTYEILPGADAAAFTVAGSQLKTAAAFDFESKASYSITVRVHDGANTFDQPLAISVTDVNESPTDIVLSTPSVPENQSVGTVVGTLWATDPDSGESYSYEILPGDNAASFAIVGNQLTTAAVFNYETKSSYPITLRLHDGGNTLDKPFTITVADLAEFGMQQGKARPVTIRDGDGDLVTLSLTGGGTGTVQPGNSIALAGTSAKSALSIKVKKGTAGDGIYHLSGLSSDGLIKSISATAVMLSGQVALNTLNQDPAKLSLSIKLGQISNADIRIQRLPVSTLAVSGDVSSTRLLTTASIKTLSAWTLLDTDILVGVATNFAGHFAGHSDFTNPAAKLTSLTVGGRKLPKGASHLAYVNGVHLSAPSIGTLKLANVSNDPDAIHGHLLSDTGTLTITALSPLTAGVSVLTRGTWKPTTAGRPDVFDVV